MGELLEQLMEEATASSLKGKLSADTGKTTIDIICDMIVSLTNISLSLKASKSALERQVESYKGLELSYHTEVESLSKQIEGLKAINEAKAREIEDLREQLGVLQSTLQSTEALYVQEQATARGLVKKVLDKDTELKQLSTELEQVHSAWQDLYMREGSHTAEVAYYKQQAKKAEEVNVGLREEIEGLKAQQQQTDTVGNTRIVYTEKQRRRMRRVYKDCNYSRTEALKVLHAEGIMVSYKHLGRIVSGMKPDKSK